MASDDTSPPSSSPHTPPVPVYTTPSSSHASSWLPKWSSKEPQPTTHDPPIPQESASVPLEAPETSNTPIPPTTKPAAGLWSWLGYAPPNPPESTDPTPPTSPSSAVPVIDNEMITPDMDAPTKTWRSYFFTEADTAPPSLTSPTEPPQPTDPSQPNDTPAAEPGQASKNQVLPSIGSQHRLPDLPPSLFTRTIHMIQTLFSRPSPPMADLVRQMKSDPQAMAKKRFVVIGVHGWFPSKFVLRSVVGEPTGTSAKFCDETAKAIRHYFEVEHELTLPLECITLIPLQWEGKVMDRVDKLYHFLVDNPASLEAVKTADVIFWTTHSQGTPVSTILMDRLLDENLIQLHRQPVCFLAMAGIAHGPFPYLKGNLIVKYFEADAARELFDFMDSKSDISQRFHQALASILRQGVKTILVGSMQDQVVPLYSAIMANAQHPNILRALYVDGHVYSDDDFLINLIVFALRLRNAGLSDHGLLLHTSEVLAGNLYAWEGGHSTIYEEPSVYSLAPTLLFNTAPVGPLVRSPQQHGPSTQKDAKLDAFTARTRWNPYYLTWAMRGIFDDPQINQHFSQDLDRLRHLFDGWHPSSTKLREIKFRLEPIKARL